ncbi:serine hydrolase [Nannocystis bainbridge]|uniref:Serine hydrolase n=1 Tax=Nannocystis bainbridge TaxID=2995303 RepID=A0ABT5E4C4_9BACT|nr:serine hydrolase [Nannocystis bainbridge]MDC0720713.1 serine hydrolase [Nannocystis bainbridge]
MQLRARVALLFAAVLACHDDAAEADPHAVDYGDACRESDCAPEIPMTGQVSPAFVELDIAMRQFVKARCVGAGVLSVSLRGRRVYKRGFGRMAGPAAADMPGCNDGPMADVDRFQPEATFVQPDTPLRLGSVSKFLTAAMARRLIGARIEQHGLQDMYPTPSHARIADPALGLLPPDLLAAFAGARCGPVTVDDVAAGCTRSCGDAGPDVRWRDVTVGDLLAHTSGLPGKAANWGAHVVPNFGALRGFTGEADWAAEDAALRARYPEFAGDIEATRTWLQQTLPARHVYFVSRYDRRDTDPQREWLGVFLTRCLVRDPAGASDDGAFKGPYSNTNYAVLDSVVAHLSASGRYAAEAGHPEQHADSALREFLADLELGGGVASVEAIFRTPAAQGSPALSDIPELRAWDGRTYRPLDWEDKRPYCVWQGDRCDFSPWLARKSTRPRWDFAGLPAPLGVPLAGQALTAGTGALSAEAPALLRIVHRYALGDDDILQGRPRESCGEACNFVMDKAGSLGGGRAYAISLPGGTREVTLPGLAPDGRLSDLGPRLRLAITEPADVDVVVMVGQSDDGRDAGSVVYSDLDEMIRFGLSRVDWAAVEAELAAQAIRVVGLAIDDRGDANYWCADDRLTVRRGDPAGVSNGELLSRDPYRLPATRIGVDVVAVARALDRPGDQVVAWYDDGHVGRGDPHDLRGAARPEPYRPAPGRTYRDLAAVVVTPAGEAIALYHDGAASFGTLTDLAAHGLGRFEGRDPVSVDALALAPDGRLFVLHRDGSVDITDLAAFARDE